VNATPATVALRVPGFDPIDAARPPAAVTGHFTLDLVATPSISKQAQTYYVYAFSGGLAAGPFLTAFVTEDMLPTRAS
jgi:hypothetical protein